MQRKASCACGQLWLQAEGDPIRVSLCSCLKCQRRTGSAVAAVSHFRREQITAINGVRKEFTRCSETNRWVKNHFCPECGATAYYEAEVVPDVVAVPVGAFADPSFPAPTIFCSSNPSILGYPCRRTSPFIAKDDADPP